MSSTAPPAPDSPAAITMKARSDTTVVVAASLVAIGIAVVYWAARIGFRNPTAPLLRSIGLALFMLAVPTAIRVIVNREGRWTGSHGFITLAALVVAAFSGMAAPWIGFNPFPLFGLAGTAAFLFLLVRWLRDSSFGHILAIVAGAGAFVVWTSGVVWGRIYKSPLFLEMMAVDGVVHHDELYQTGLSNMLGTYGVAGIGHDGLSAIAYHWGSNWFFAQLANLVSVPVIVFYQMTFAITMIPLFFASVILVSIELRRRRLRSAENADAETDPARRWFFWAIFVAATTGVVPITGMDAFGVWSSNLMISESYTIGIPATLLFVATVAAWWSERGSGLRSGSGVSLGDYAFLWIFVPFGLVVLGHLKVSLMVLGVGALLYAMLRTSLFRRWQVLVSAALAIAAALMAWPTISAPSHQEGVALFDFMKGFVPLDWWQFFFLFHLLWPIVFATVRLRQERIATVGELADAIRARRILDVEIVTAVAIAGVLPGLILHIDGGSAFYFSDVQRWLALTMLLSVAPALVGRRAPGPSFTLKRVAFGLLALPFVFSTAKNTVYWAERMLRANIATRHALYPPERSAAIIPSLRSITQLTDAAALQDGLRGSKNFRVVSEMIRLGETPLPERRRTALFVPQTERAFWGLLTRPGDCTFDGFIAPSLAATAMIDGMPPIGCELTEYYGIGESIPRARPQTEADAEPAALCARARKSGLDRVVVVRFSGAEGSPSSVVSCS